MPWRLNTNECRIMQISRPRLNYLIILGALLFYITMILLAVPTRDKDVFLGLFKMRPWTVALGYSLCYCPIIMKMFRVYYIVNNPLPNKVRIIVILNLCKFILLGMSNIRILKIGFWLLGFWYLWLLTSFFYFWMPPSLKLLDSQWPFLYQIGTTLALWLE